MKPRAIALLAAVLLATTALAARAQDAPPAGSPHAAGPHGGPPSASAPHALPSAANSAVPLTARELRGSMLESDSITVARVEVTLPGASAGATGAHGSPGSMTTRQIAVSHARGPWMKRFVANFMPPTSEVHSELCPTPQAFPGQDKPWLVSVLWINGARERGQTYVDLANLCAFAGLMGRAPVGMDVAAANADSLFVLFLQALPADTLLQRMTRPVFSAANTAGGVFVPAQPSVKVQPVYPDSLRKAGVAGTVKVRALVGPAGDVQETSLLEGVFGLDAPAVVAVRQWRFKPATRGGKAVASWVIVPVTFSLEPAGAEPKH